MNNFVVAFLPCAKKIGTTLHSWNLLASMRALHDGVENRHKKTLLIYTSADTENVDDITQVCRQYGYQKVVVYADIAKLEVKEKEYIKLIEDTYLSEIMSSKPDNVIIDKIFWIMGYMLGEQTFTGNTEKVKDLLTQAYKNKSEVYSGDYLQHLIYQSLLNYFCSFNMPMIHQLIVDPIEADVSVYLHELMHTSIRRHFVHPLINRPSVYANPFIVLPFYDKTSAFYNDDKNVKSNDFVFGLTGYDETRKKFILDFKDILVDKNNFYYCYKDDSGNMVDTRLSYNEYLTELAKSKTTLLIPAYDVKTFSVHRFIEAVSVGCLPIIYEAVYEYGFLGYPDTIKYIGDHLVIHEDIMEINSKIDEVCQNHASILNGLLKTSYFRMLLKNESTRLFY